MKARLRRIFRPNVVLTVTIAVIGAVVAIVGLNSIKVAMTLAIQNGILTPWLLLSLLPFTMLSYGLRVLRWHFLVRRLAPSIRLTESIYSQVVGFAFSPTPGRVAELYKLKLIERWSEQPAVRFLPAVIVERLSDVVAFASLAVVGSVLSWSSVIVGQRTVALVVLGIGAILLVGIYRYGFHRLGGPLESILTSAVLRQRIFKLGERIPAVARFLALTGQLRAGGARMSDPATLVMAIAFVTLGRVGDSVVLWKLAAIVGVQVPFSLAIFMIGTSGLVGGITFSPGGLGATEASLIGLVVARGADLGTGMMVALGTRALIYWLWVAIGLVVFLAGQIYLKRQAALSERLKVALVVVDRSPRHDQA